MLTEHLLRPDRRKILLPYIASLTAMLAKRFRKQARTLAGSTALTIPHLEDSIAFRDALAEKLDLVWSEGSADFIGLDPDRVPAELRFPTATKDYVTRLMHGVDETTNAALPEVLKTLVDAGVDRTKAHAHVVSSFRQSIEQRADMIAETEVSGAFNRGMLDTAKASELDLLKSWSAEPDACPICTENAEAGAIPLEDEFPSGDTEPGAHPNCKCALEFSELQPSS